jgi:hypothetical protein
MDFFYDGQIRRYVTQFMRIFIGFKYQAGNGDQQTVPVMYGDMSRQVAALIKENSENKMPSVPRIACYISGLELDQTRLSDPSFVSKVSVRQKDYTEDPDTGEVSYYGRQGGSYTVERLMPTPFKLTMKADIWTSSIDQKLQLFEQIMVLFNPSLEIQTTDNYLDWTSLSVVDIQNINFSSRSIPQGAETEIDIMTIDFTMPVWISPPAKVKKLGVVKSIISNVFSETGEVIELDSLVIRQTKGKIQINSDRYRIMLFKSNNGQQFDYDVTIVDPSAAIKSAGIPEKDYRVGGKLTWTQILEAMGGYTGTSRIYFDQAAGNTLSGTFAVNPVDPSILVVTFDPDTIPANTLIDNNGLKFFSVDQVDVGFDSASGKGTVDAIIDPYKFNPITRPNGRDVNVRYLVLEDINTSPNRGGLIDRGNFDPADGSSRDSYDGPDGWKNLDGSDPVVPANSIITWTGSEWKVLFDPRIETRQVVVQNMKTLIKYKWVEDQWLKAFEGEYAPGTWRFDLDA